MIQVAAETGGTVMWTNEHRGTYRRAGPGFPSNLTDAEWGVLVPLIPDATPGGRPRKTDMTLYTTPIIYLYKERFGAAVTGVWRSLRGIAPVPHPEPAE